jgi:hypothetical protein
MSGKENDIDWKESENLLVVPTLIEIVWKEIGLTGTGDVLEAERGRE